MTEACSYRLTSLMLGDSTQLTNADLKDVHLQLPSLKRLEFHQGNFAHVSSMTDKYVLQILCAVQTSSTAKSPLNAVWSWSPHCTLPGHGHHTAPSWSSDTHTTTKIYQNHRCCHPHWNDKICESHVCRPTTAALSATLSKTLCWTAVMHTTCACNSQRCARCHSDAARLPSSTYTTAAVCAHLTCKVCLSLLQALLHLNRNSLPSAAAAAAAAAAAEYCHCLHQVS